MTDCPHGGYDTLCAKCDTAYLVQAVGFNLSNPECRLKMTDTRQKLADLIKEAYNYGPDARTLAVEVASTARQLEREDVAAVLRNAMMLYSNIDPVHGALKWAVDAIEKHK